MIAILELSAILVTSLMLTLWLIYKRTHNAGIVDIGWALSFILTALAALILGQGPLLRKGTIAFLATLWAVRLALHITRRYLKSPEDPRYAQIRDNWSGDPSGIKFLLLFLFQGALVLLLSLPFFLIASNTGPFSLWEGAGTLVWLIGVVGESIADGQLYRFKEPGKVCQKGLWKYSRHPNYFFEWVVWIGFFLMALPAPFGWFAILSPILILVLLLKVSGIPPAEAQSLRTKGEAYRHYQRTTSAFFPWFRNIP